MNRILLLMAHQENRRRLARMLSGRYQLLEGDSDQQLEQPFDLCILESPILKRLLPKIEARRRREHPAFLPFLLVTPREEARFDTRDLWEVVDDLIVLPIENSELQARVALALRARNLSNDLLRETAERQQAEADLRRSELRFQGFTQSGIIGIATFTLSGKLTSSNDAFLKMTGFTREDLDSGKLRWDRLTPSEWIPRTEQAMEELRIRGWYAPFEKECFRKDGSKFWGLFGGVLPRGSSEGLGLVLDITERRQAEEELSKLAAIVQFSEDPIIGKTLDGIITSWNPAAERLYGYRAKEVIGKSLSIIVPPEHPDELPSILETIRRGGRVEHYETVRVAKNGRRLDLLVSASPIKDAAGKIVGAASTAHDLTESKRAEAERERLLEQLRESNSRLAEEGLRCRELAEEAQRRSAELDATIESIAAGVLIFDSCGRLQRMNRAGERLLGVTFEQYRLPAKDRIKLLHMEVPEQGTLRLELVPAPRALQGETVSGMVIIYHTPDGRIVWGSTSSAPIRAEGGAILGAVTIITDITEMHRLQEQRDDLLRAVSHDLRSPLTAVQGQAQLAMRILDESGQDGRLQRSAQAILVSARRMNAMIQDLVDLARLESRQLTLNRTHIELRSFVTDLKQRLVGVLDTDRIRVEIPEGLPAVWADPDRLERALANLLSNGLKYSEDEVRVTARRMDGQIRVSVIDRGPGIPREDCEHLFERYYRVKRTRNTEGLGLGLYITRLLVEAMGGRIWVKSEVSKGSTFSLTLPVV